MVTLECGCSYDENGIDMCMKHHMDFIMTGNAYIDTGQDSKGEGKILHIANKGKIPKGEMFGKSMFYKK